jgi:hypothetical protein
MGGKKLGQSLITVRLSRVFALNQLSDLVLYTLGCDEIALIGGDAAIEKIFELEQPLGSLNILVGGDAAYG